MAYELCPFHSISVRPGQWDGDSEKLCAMEPSYWLDRFPPPEGFEPGTTRQQASALPTGLPKFYEAYVNTGSNLKVLIAHPFL